jgi:nitrite reductase (NADH) small subunit
MSEIERLRVCKADDIQSGEHRLISVNGAAVCVLNVDGDYYAIRNECAHQGGPLCKGKVQPELVGEFVEPGERVQEHHGERLAIACPWHGWEYDLEKGVHLGAEDIELETFDVIVEKGTLYIEH